MAALLGNRRASFDGVQFPIMSCEVRGGLRHHLHEYPHTPGAAPEKLGRRLYVVRMAANFQNTFRSYPNLWPRGLAKLRAAFEQEKTADLDIPAIGTIKAFAHDWSQVQTSQSQSGEMANFEFIEDQSSAFLVNSLIDTSASTVEAKAAKMNAAAIRADFEKDRNAATLFDGIATAFNGFQAFKDTSEATTTLLLSKLVAMTDMCRQLDASPAMKDPVNAELIDALHDFWDAVETAATDVLSKRSPIQIYTVPALMAVSDVSRQIYGDATHAAELLQLNALPDAYAIPAATPVRYYAPAA